MSSPGSLGFVIVVTEYRYWRAKTLCSVGVLDCRGATL